MGQPTILCCYVLLLSFFSSSFGLAPVSTDRRKSPALWRLLEFHQQQQQQDGLTRTPAVRPEIMAPAGGWPQLKAAVANGADAVYLGLSSFSARARATNFDAENLVTAVQFAHTHDVKVYVAMNTLIFDPEFAEITHWIKVCEAARVDAVIVQDLGLCRYIRRIAPNLHIHSSTQQSITDAAGVDFCQEFATRVVLGRELSTAEIESVVRASSTEIEVFVHGALCVSYSGQCFSSEAWGGRSANRGQCAQACRLPYDLIVNGKASETQEDLKYVLSPQDLCGIDQVPALMKAGVSCLKIEGRLKSADYVAATTRAYRNAVDAEWKRLHPEWSNPRSSEENHTITKAELTQLFSRGQDETYTGLTTGFLEGTRHQTIVRGRSPRHRGIHAGRVLEGSSPKRGILVSGDCQLKLGDGICIDRGLAEQEELGGSIFAIEELTSDKRIVKFGRSDTQRWKEHEATRTKNEPQLVPVGAHVWKTHDAAVEKKFKKLSELVPKRQNLVSVRVEGSLDNPLVITLADDLGSVTASSNGVLVQSDGAGVDMKKIQKAIGTLGNTDFSIAGDIDLKGLDKEAWCPISWVKETRRQVVELWLQHIEKRQTGDHQENVSAPVTDALTLQDIHSHVSNLISAGENCNISSQTRSKEAKLSILCRDYSQVEAICEFLDASADNRQVVNEIVVDFLEVDGMRSAVDRIKQSGLLSVVASPRILKPGEGGIWRSMLALQPDALLIRSAGLLHQLQSMGGTGALVEVGTVDSPLKVLIPQLFGDFSLNAANALTASELLSKGLSRIAASYDLNARAISEMASLLGPKSDDLEVIMHCKMPIFHTEHCVFARFLTKGDSYLDCGHACTRNTLHLRDTLAGGDNLVLADMGCRNTVFAAQSQTGIYSVPEWRNTGILNFRIELVDERPVDAVLICSTYADALRQKIGPSHVWNVLEDVRDSNGRAAGVTFGSFQNTKERKAGQL